MLQSPDRSPMELKTFEDWIIEPQYRSVPGVADDSGFGGGTMQYQVLLDPAKLAAVGLSVPQVETALGANNANAGGGFYSQGGQFYYVRGMGRIAHARGHRQRRPGGEQRHAGAGEGRRPRGRSASRRAWASSAYEKQDDAVEGVILLRTGEKTQDVLKRVEAKTRELNQQILPKDVKVVPFYDRSDLIDAHHRRRSSSNLLRGMLLVVVVLIFFLYDVRAGLIVADHHPAGAAVRLRLPRPAERLRQPALDRRDRLRHPGRRRGRHGGEHLPPARRCATARRSTSATIIRDAAAEVDRPLVYAVAVIVAGFLPIYVLSRALRARCSSRWPTPWSSP